MSARGPITNMGVKVGSNRFQKGKSGNPGGRSKAHAVIARLIAENTDDGAELAAFALGTLRQKSEVRLKDGREYAFAEVPDDPKSRCYAHNWLTERVAGKPPVTVSISSEEPAERVNFDALTDEQLEALAALDAASQPAVEPEPGGPDPVH